MTNTKPAWQNGLDMSKSHELEASIGGGRFDQVVEAPQPESRWSRHVAEQRARNLRWNHSTSH